MSKFLILPAVFVVFAMVIVIALNSGIGDIALDITQPEEPAEPATFQEAELILRSMRSSDDYTAPDGRFDVFSLTHDEVTRQWHGIAATGTDPRPVVILLHGSNRNGAAMLDMWQATATDRNLNLIAPDARDLRGWRSDHDGAAFIRAVMQDAMETMPIDPTHIYLFGHSSGAQAAIELANRSDLSLRAVAVHGGGFPEQSMRPALLPTPVRVYLGDADHTLSTEEARQQASTLAQMGHPTELIVIGDHTHWYYDLAPRLSFEVVDWFAEMAAPQG